MRNVLPSCNRVQVRVCEFASACICVCQCVQVCVFIPHAGTTLSTAQARTLLSVRCNNWPSLLLRMHATAPWLPFKCFIVKRLQVPPRALTRTHAHTHTRTYTHTHIHTYTHTYTHTQTLCIDLTRVRQVDGLKQAHAVLLKMQQPQEGQQVCVCVCVRAFVCVCVCCSINDRIFVSLYTHCLPHARVHISRHTHYI